MIARRQIRAFRGEVAGVVLHLRPGAKVRQLDADGATLAVTFDAHCRLRPNVGDRLVVCDADLDRDVIALVEVDHVGGDGTPTVRVRCGELPVGPVHVLPARKAKAPARRTRLRGTLAMPGASIAAIARRRLARPGGVAP